MTKIGYALASTCMALAMAGHAAIIDDFKDGTSALVATNALPVVTATDTGAAINGADRDIELANTGGNSVSASNVAAVMNGFFQFDAQSSTTGKLTLSYALPAALDLTMAGSLDSLEIVDLFIQGGAIDVTVTLEDSDNDLAVSTVSIPTNPTGATPQVTRLAFDDFIRDIVDFDLTAIDSLEFLFIAADAGTDFALAEIRTANEATSKLTTVPEPGVLALGIGGLLLYGLRESARRRARRTFLTTG